MMVVKPKSNPEKWMLLLFPLITLAFFLLGVAVVILVPTLLRQLF